MQISPQELMGILKLHDEKNLLAKVKPQLVQECCDGAVKALQNLKKNPGLSLEA